MEKKIVRLGIIGCGLMGREIVSAAARWCHLLDIKVRPIVTGVCDTNAAALAWFKEHAADVKLVTGDYHELLASPDIDAVYCAVPHNLHAKLYVDIIRAGKHLLGEKPFGIDRAANREIMAAVKARPEVVVRCSSEYPFFPGVQRIVQMARQGRFGTILEVDCGFLHSSDLDPQKPINWKRIVATCGEYGCMGDLGMHVFHVPLRLGWKPLNVRAVLSKVMKQRPDGKGGMAACETWDNATLFCELRNGDVSFPMIAKTQRIAPGETNTWYLTVKGTQLSARFNTKHPRTLETMPFSPGGAQSWNSEDLGFAPLYKTITGGIFEFGFPDSMQQMLAAFCDQVAAGNGTELPFGCATPEEAAMTHDIFTAALESQKQATTVKV